jgi:NADH-quinone oxidoreductase subunit C
VALRSAHTFEEIETELRHVLGDAVLDVADNRGQLIVRVTPDRRPDALRLLKTLDFTFYSFGSAVDWPDENRFEVLDHVYSIEDGLRVTVKCDVPRDEPRLPTAIGVYEGADWAERETAELFGITFAGHPRMRRLLLPDFYEGYPLRKDHELRARVEKPWPGEFFEG